MHRRFAYLVAFVAIFAAGCSRSVSIGSSAPGTSYSVSVNNTTATVMDVSFNDGKDHFLGSVPAGKTERFVIAGPARQVVGISGRAQTGSRTSGPYQVSLVVGTSVSVTLR